MISNQTDSSKSQLLSECELHSAFGHLIFCSNVFSSPTFVLKTLQCSVSCGYGIQTRVVSCMGPSQPQLLSPSLCVHMPKPITIQSCSARSCRGASPPPPPTYPASPPGPTKASAILQDVTAPAPSAKPGQHAEEPHSSSQGRSDLSQPCASPDACGRLLLEPSGTVDLRDVNGRCTVFVGRPLDEVIHIKVESGSLNCKLQSNSAQIWRMIEFAVCRERLEVGHCLFPGEYVLFFDRLALVRKCGRLTGAELTTRTNVLLVRQGLLTPGNGVTFTYTSQKNTKRSHHRGQNASAFERGGVRRPTPARR